MIRAWCALLVLLPLRVLAAGEVNFAVGDASVVGPDGARRPLARGVALAPGDTVEVGASGRAQVRMSDGTRVSVQPGSQLLIRRYAETESGALLELTRGALRAVTGALSKVGGAGFRIETPTATVGIRGTEFLLQVGDGTTVNVDSGIVDMCNRGGCLTLFAGEAGRALTADAKPRLLEARPVIAPPPPPVKAAPGSEDFRAAAIKEGLVTIPQFAAFAYDDPFHGDFGFAVPAYEAPGRVGVFYDVFGPVYGRGSARLAESGYDGLIGFGRWSDGTVWGDFGGGPESVLLGPNQGAHFVFGQPTFPMPVSGIATYNLLGATRATSHDGSLGLGRISGGLSVDFFSSRVGVDMAITFPTAAYHILSSGGIRNPAESEIELLYGPFFTNPYYYVPTTGTAGDACGGVGRDDCLTDVVGLFVGDEATRAGLTFDILDLRLDTTLHGAATFTRGRFDVIPSDVSAFAFDDGMGGGLFLDQRTPRLGPDGGALHFVGVSGSFLDHGSTSIEDVFYDGVAGLGRWSDGTLTEDLGDGVYELTLGPTQGVHYAFGTPTSPMPVAATATYTLLASTRATSDDGSLGFGTITGGLAVDFLRAKVGADLTVNFPGAGYRMRTTGGLDDTTDSELDILGATFQNKDYYIPTSGTAGAACRGAGCRGDVSGFFAGSGASRAGIGLTIEDMGLATLIHGSALFARASSDPIYDFDGAFAFDEAVVGGTAYLDAGHVTMRGDEARAFYGSVSARAAATPATDVHFDGTIGWGRWTGGTIVGDVGTGPFTLDMTGGQAFHYAFGLPTSAMPTTGTATYDLLGATPATSDGGVLGEGVFAGALAVDFLRRKVGADVTVTFPTAGYRMRTSGGLADMSNSELDIYGSTFENRGFYIPTSATAGAACGGAGCRGDIYGFFAGSQASRAGIAYNIADLGLATAVHGAAAFRKR